MTDLRTAAQQALEAMSNFESGTNGLYEGEFAEEIAALKAALAEPVQQGCDHCNSPLYAAIRCRVCGRVTEPAPPQRKPLTREEAIALWADKSDGPSNSEIVLFARAIERAHGIGVDE